MKYKLRAKCLQNVVDFILNKNVQIINFQITNAAEFPEVEMVFETETNLNTMLTILYLTEDSLVMCETLQPFENYTGQQENGREIQWPEHPFTNISSELLTPKTLKEMSDLIAEAFGLSKPKGNE